VAAVVQGAVMAVGAAGHGRASLSAQAAALMIKSLTDSFAPSSSFERARSAASSSMHTSIVT